MSKKVMHFTVVTALAMALAIMISLAGALAPFDAGEAERAEAAAKKPKALVVYFSNTGNTAKVAKKVAKASGAATFRIKPKVAYTKADTSYDDTECRAYIEQTTKTARPEIKSFMKASKLKKYDLIFVGYPIWHGTEPKVMKTFLEKYNLKGKRVVPFCTSGGSGISGSIKGIKASAKGAKFGKGKELTDASSKAIKAWTKKMVKWAKK